MSDALPFPIIDLATHPEGELLRAIGRAGALQDEGARAETRDSRVRARWIKENCHEVARLDDFITATRARTPEGVRAKVEHVLRYVDPEEPETHFGGLTGHALSALWDVMASEGLG